MEFAEIRFSFAPSKLLTHNFDPIKTINNVKLIRPQVTLYYSDEPRQINPDLSLEKVFEEIITNIKKFPEIDHVKIRDGSCCAAKCPGKPRLRKSKFRCSVD
ncbi:MAG: hypothetical protein R3C26_15580 [Calditrichia bacterium]